MDINNINDYLFQAAKELIDSRHSIMEYSPTEDIICIYETISFHSYAASIECMVTRGISNFASFPGLSALLKYPTLIANYYSMINGINKIAGIKVSNVDLKNLSNIICDIGLEITKHTYHVYESKISFMSKKEGSSLSISNIKWILYKYIFSVAVYSDSIAFGWAYLKTIEDLYKRKNTEIDIIQLKANVIDKIKNFSNRMNSIASCFSEKYIDSLTKDIGNSEQEAYNYLYGGIQDSMAFRNYMKSIEYNELRSIIRKNATVHNSDLFIISDQLSTLAVDLFNCPQIGYTTKNIIEHKDGFSVCANMLCDMQKKYLLGAVRISDNCVDDLIIRYSKYGAKDFDIPGHNVFYEKRAEYYPLMPCPQSVEGFVNTLQKLINKRTGYKKFEISWIVSLWGQMIADITNSITEEKKVESTLKSISPYLLTCIIFYFASTDVTKQIPYNLTDFRLLQTFFNRKYTNLTEILQYCPIYYHSLSAKDEEVINKEYKNLINFVLTRYVGNIFFQYLNNKGGEEQILDAFDSFNIISEIDRDVQKIVCLIS